MRARLAPPPDTHRRNGRPVTTLLRQRLPVQVVVLGDSTSNDPTDWAPQWWDALPSQYPGVVPVRRLWDDTLKHYAPAVPTASLPSWAFEPDAARIASTAGLVSTAPGNCVAAIVTVSALGGSGTRHFTRHDGGDPNRRSFFSIAAGNALRVTFYPTGSAASAVNANSTVAAAVTATRQFGYEILGDDGTGQWRVRFYERASSADAWTQVGADVLGGAATGFTWPTVTGTFQVAGFVSGGLTANVHDAYLIDGTLAGGQIIASWIAGAHPPGTIRTDAEGNVWTGTNTLPASGYAAELLNGSVGGASVTTHTADLASTLAGDPTLVVVNIGHNHGTTTQFAATFETFLDAVAAQAPAATLAVCVQNPQTSAATNPTQHRVRNAQIRQVAHRRGLAVIDADALFAARGDFTSWMNDTVHPNAVGAAAWAGIAADTLALTL